MSQQRFIRCPHCGLPHEAELVRCPITGSALTPPSRRSSQLKAPRPVRPPPVADDYSWEHSIHPWSVASDDESHDDLSLEDLSRFVGRMVEGKYRIEELIGRGGMGAVFRAKNMRIDKPVALKIMYRGYTPGSESERRFLREARVAGSLGHPNIVEVFDLGHLEDGKPFQVMELLEGQTLAERIRSEGALTEARAAEIADQVLSALEAAHDRGVIHRDLKPDNIFLVERSGRTIAKLLDFGVSKTIAGDHSLSMTMTGVVVGTPYYLSPEQARGDRDFDHRVDIWAMGVVMYEMLTGALPFNGDNYNQLLVKILQCKPVKPSRWQPRITPGVEAIVMRALSLNARDRFATAIEMLYDLRTARKTAAANTIEQRYSHVDFDSVSDVTVQGSLESIVPEDPTEVSDKFNQHDLDRLKIRDEG